MNFLTALVVVIFLVFIFLGYKRGLFRSILKLLLAGISLLLAYLLTPIMSNIIINNTSMDDAIADKVYVVIEDIARQQVLAKMQDTVGEISDDLVDELTELALEIEPSRSQQVDMIQKMKIPEFMSDALISNNNDEMREQLGVDGFYKYLAYYISYMITNAVAFILTFIFIIILTNIIYVALGIVSKLPIIGSIDKIGGVLFGILEALLIVWVLFVLIAVLANTSVGENLYSQISESKILSGLYDKNILYSVVTKLVK